MLCELAESLHHMLCELAESLHHKAVILIKS